MITTASLGEPVFETIMNVVIIYDDSASAAKTNAMLDKASHQAGEVAPSDVKPWRVDLLNLPPTATEALREAADAHLIVFSIASAQSAPRRAAGLARTLGKAASSWGGRIGHLQRCEWQRALRAGSERVVAVHGAPRVELHF